jgi:hypothetical protein
MAYRPRVANINDKTTSLSGKDTAEQHSAFWKYTLIPILRQFEQILESQFFVRFNLKEKGVFDLQDIPELQESEDAQSKRDIAEINAGLKTINGTLVVNRETNNHAYFTERLERLGFTNVKTTALDKDGLSLVIHKTKPDIVIMGVRFYQCSTPYMMALLHQEFPKLYLSVISILG